jgi:small-conductance mechanosensitive channel
MTFKDILEYQLFTVGKYSINSYHIIAVVIIFLITKIFLWSIKKLLKRQSDSGKIDIGTSHAIYQLARYILWITAIILIFQNLNIKLTFLLAGSAALLVGVGLGLQEIFKDLISGFFMLFEGNLKVQDIVEVEGNLVGRVIKIGLRTTKIETRDKVIIILPNSKFISDRLINWSLLEKRTRFYVSVGVAYGSNVDLVSQILVEAGLEHKKVANDPKPYVMFTDFGESSLDFKLMFWTMETFWVERIKSDLRFSINRKFIEKGVTIPFPQRDIHIKSPD